MVGMRRWVFAVGAVVWGGCGPAEPEPPPQVLARAGDDEVSKERLAPQPLCKACPGGPAPKSGVVDAVRKLQTACGSPRETVWVVEYTLPEREKPWRDQAYPVGEAAKACLERGLAGMQWPVGHAGKIVAYDESWDP